VLTIGQRNLFFPEIKSHSKSRDMNHSYLRISQQDEEKKTGENAHINTCKRMHKFHQDHIVLLNIIGEFQVRHCAKVRKNRQGIGGNGGGQLVHCRRGVVFDWSIYPMFRLRNGDSIINFETVTIIAFKSHPKLPSSPMMYPIQLDHKSYCQEFGCPLPPFVLAQLRSFPQFEIIKCLVDVFHWILNRFC